MSNLNEPGAEPPTPPNDQPKLGRRRLLQSGLAGGPVLMTLVSRPVFAQCTTPSGFVSANASTAGRGVTCSGHLPTYWSNPNTWGPTGFNPNGEHFNHVFSPDIPPNNNNPKLLDVVQGNGGSSATINQVAQYLAAALLNAAAGLTPVLSVPAVKGIWTEFATTGFGTFSPSSGVHWNASEIVDYLTTTM